MDPYFHYRVKKNVTLVCAWIGLGFSAELVGPTLPNLKDRFYTDYAGICIVLGLRSIGMMVGSIIGGFLHEVFYLHSDLLISLSLMLISLATALIPWCSSLGLAVTTFFFSGFGEGVLNTGGNTMVMHLWRDKATGPMHSLHFGFGLGAILAPQLVRPFLLPESVAQNQTADFSRIEIPYAIVGFVVFMVSLVVLGFYLKGLPKDFPVRKSSKKLQDMASLQSCAPGSTVFGIAIFCSLLFYFMQAVGGEKAYGKFLFSFAYESGLMDKNEAAVLQSVFWISFTSVRLLCVLLTKCIPLTVIIVCDVCIAILSSCMLVIFAAKNVTYLWIFTITIAVSIAMAFPNGMAWASLNLTINSVGVMVLLIGGSSGGFIYQYVTGYLFQTIGPHTLMYVMTCYAFCLGLTFILMTLTVKVLKPVTSSGNFQTEMQGVQSCEKEGGV